MASGQVAAWWLCLGYFYSLLVEGALWQEMTFTGILVLVATLLHATTSDTVIWDKCKYNFNDLRVLGPLPDLNATTLALELCNITEVKPGDFDGLPNLAIITLNDNKIQHLDADVFTTVNETLRGLFLEHNFLTEVPRFWELSLFPNMTTLTLSHNNITTLDDPKTFSSMYRLELLSLDTNGISHLHPAVFKPLTNLEIISLHHNNLKHMSEKMFHVNSLRIIFLQNNQISYIAPGAIRSSKLEALFLKNNKLAYLPQRFVLQLKSSSTSFDLFKFGGNPWQCGCLLEVLAEVNNTGIKRDRTESCDSKGVPCDRSEAPQLHELSSTRK